MLGFLRISTRKPKPVFQNIQKYLTPCSRVIAPDTGANVALSHSRIPYTNLSGRPITTLEVLYGHFTYNASIEWWGTSTLTVRAAVEYPVGTITPLLDAGGNRDISIASGSIGAALKLSGISIPNGAVYYIRTRCIASGGDSFMPTPYYHGASFEGGQIQSYTSTTNDGSDYTLSGTQPVTSGGRAYGAYAVSSREVGNKQRSFAIIGDSIAKGNTVGVSFAETGILAAGYGFINLSVSGSRVENSINFSKRMALMQALGITDVVMTFPTNDLKNGRTVTQCQGYFNTLWTNLKTAGIQKIIQSTCTPRTVTDIYTPDPSPAGAYTGGAVSYRAQINAWFRSIAGQNNKPDYIFELSDLLESGRDTGQWANSAHTVDLLHLSISGTSIAGNGLTTFLQQQGY